MGSNDSGLLEQFHPAIRAWFASAFAAPTPAQLEAWPAIKAGRHALVAAPTGSGKTLAAFLAAIDGLVRDGIERGLPDETRVVYVSPLKALSNDIQRNLDAPLAGIRAELEQLGLPDVEIRTQVRTGDTPQAERESMRRRPPHIVVTTPESLYILLTSKSGRRMLATTRTVIVDEIHALAPNKRGAHLALSLERLEALTGHEPVRIGLSATQKPIQEVARFLVGGRLDYVSGHSVSALVFQRHKHVINLYVWPTNERDSKPALVPPRQGYNLVRWSAAGITAWAVSDLNQRELMEFAQDYTADKPPNP